ncbi:hypothetical protein SAMN05428974_0627 [Sphingopyxis sp. YR583]|uniref:hypothetical protein n=1 Tax=Sphingopyxis sp. YR583 TaxID=1881047 RepID=UPI0008A796B5|nr:hypothetical protein [Sphingopyxis sp. YR583]SEH13007.1 hypothetical protein SAMN05428974_0627 [Sphingopyxis sp. YR583]
MADQQCRPSISFPVPLALPKIARSAMMQLVVETEHCPFILDRVLGTIREHDGLPFTIRTDRGTRIQRIEVDLGAQDDEAALVLLQALRRLPNVRGARFMLPAELPEQPVLSTKL